MEVGLLSMCFGSLCGIDKDSFTYFKLLRACKERPNTARSG